MSEREEAGLAATLLLTGFFMDDLNHYLVSLMLCAFAFLIVDQPRREQK